MYDLAIIGGGPAAVAAGVYGSRKRLKTVFITKDWGGQSAVSTDIQNWIGTPSISGAKWALSLKDHLKSYAGEVVTMREGEMAIAITNNPARTIKAAVPRQNDSVELESDGQETITKGGEKSFLVKTDKAEYEARAVLIATGSKRKKLAAPGADKYENKGIVYCASCDGPLFADMDTAVVGGGNAGFETAAQLLAYAKSVVLLHRGGEFKADPVTVKKVLANPKMRAILKAEILEVKGSDFVEQIVYREKEGGKKVELPVQGIFVEIGSMPATELVEGLVERDRFGQIIVDPKNQRTSAEGVWAAGDCTNGLFHQNNIAAGDAVKALEDIYLWLHRKQ